jgi:hypothetical protein
MERTPQETAPFTATATATALEAWNIYVDTHLKVFQQLTDFWANVSKEQISLYAELQAGTLEMVQESKSSMLQCLHALPEEAINPVGTCQKTIQTCADSAAQITKLLQGNAQAVLRSGEQYWITAQHTTQGIKTSYTQMYDKLTSLYSPA